MEFIGKEPVPVNSVRKKRKIGPNPYAEVGVQIVDALGIPSREQVIASFPISPRLDGDPELWSERVCKEFGKIRRGLNFSLGKNAAQGTHYADAVIRGEIDWERSGDGDNELAFAVWRVVRYVPRSRREEKNVESEGVAVPEEGC